MWIRNGMSGEGLVVQFVVWRHVKDEQKEPDWVSFAACLGRLLASAVLLMVSSGLGYIFPSLSRERRYRVPGH